MAVNDSPPSQSLAVATVAPYPPPRDLQESCRLILLHSLLMVISVPDVALNLVFLLLCA